MKWTVYLLKCADGTIYVGSTTEMPRRFAEHAAGKGGAYTRGRRPVILVYREPQPDRSHAQRREAQIKGWPREKKLVLVSSNGSTQARRSR